MHDLPLINTIAAGFTAAWVLGLLTQSLRLSPIVGYLLAGIVIGPYTPGFQGDLKLAHQLAEVGVILLMFGVGLHFHLQDLLAVKAIAIPGALGQSLVATVASVIVFGLFGFSIEAGAVIGMAMAVASTVVLMRVLMDADALRSPAGHIAVGWLLVEDVLTVIVLVLIPIWGANAHPGEEVGDPLTMITIAIGKLLALVGLVFVVGRRVIPWALTNVARLRSRELFTLTVMVFSIAMAAGSYWLFGASMALGAFLAGMMVALSPVSHQAAADALPLRDAFAVLFFVSVGMLFDPSFILREPLLMLAALAIIFVVKPLTALVIVAALGYSARTALTVAVGLAQIGEFSFILAELARQHHLMPEVGHHLLVGAAIISITLNPMLFRSLDGMEQWLRGRPRLWTLLNARAERRMMRDNRSTAVRILQPRPVLERRAIIIGYGPVGQTVTRLLREAGLNTVVIDMNMDTIAMLRAEGHSAIFGDASREAILESAGVDQATYLILTLPQPGDRTTIVAAARDLNPKLKIFVRARYLRERDDLVQVGATSAIFEEAEAAVALARMVLTDTGASRDSIEQSLRDIRTRLILDNVSALQNRTVRAIMIPWMRVRRLRATATLEDVRRQVSEQRYSRWPVVRGESGSPAGYLLVKDLIGVSSDWTSLIRPLKRISPNASVAEVLQEFQRDAATLGIVSENEVPLGLVTIEDILEQVIGRMEDEYPRHEKLRLSDRILIGHSQLKLSAVTAAEAIEELAAVIPASQVPEGANVAQLAIEREREFPTHLGFGIAVPHARCPGLAEPLVIFGRSDDGVDFDGSQQRVHLIFLMVTPREQPQTQVLILGDIALLASREKTREALRTAQTPDAVRVIIREVELQHEHDPRDDAASS